MDTFIDLVVKNKLLYLTLQRMNFPDVLMLFLPIHCVPYMARHEMKG